MYFVNYKLFIVPARHTFYKSLPELLWTSLWAILHKVQFVSEKFIADLKLGGTGVSDNMYRAEERGVRGSKTWGSWPLGLMNNNSVFQI